MKKYCKVKEKFNAIFFFGKSILNIACVFYISAHLKILQRFSLSIIRFSPSYAFSVFHRAKDYGAG